MTEISGYVDHAEHSIGGLGGHAFRRFTHISMSVIPLAYYLHGDTIAAYASLEPREFVSAICITILLIEVARLRLGIVVIGQREYESNQVSALAWGG